MCQKGRVIIMKTEKKNVCDKINTLLEHMSEMEGELFYKLDGFVERNETEKIRQLKKDLQKCSRILERWFDD